MNVSLWTREDAYGRPGDPSARSGWRGPIDFPRIQGADVAGRIAAVGPDLDDGLVGLAAVQIARARNARVIAISSGSKIDAVREVGAHVVLDRARDVVEQARAAAPEGVDVALDVVAGDVMNEGLPLLRDGGRWVVAGALGGYGAEGENSQRRGQAAPRLRCSL